jgi:hypothetical protein
MYNPKVLLGVAFVLLLLGVILPFLEILQYLQSTFFINFFAFGASFLGVILGMVGAMMLALQSRNRHKNKH